MNNLVEIFILVLLAIAFLQSGIDKIADWKGNLEWLKSHFSNSMIAKQVPLSLAIVLILEMISGILAIIAILSILINDNTEIAVVCAITSLITLLFLFFGQRIAKDYEGAKTIVIYFIPTLFLLYLLQ